MKTFNSGVSLQVKLTQDGAGTVVQKRFIAPQSLRLALNSGRDIIQSFRQNLSLYCWKTEKKYMLNTLHICTFFTLKLHKHGKQYGGA